MVLNTLKCDHLTPLGLKGLTKSVKAVCNHYSKWSTTQVGWLQTTAIRPTVLAETATAAPILATIIITS